ncbi:MAG TPA: hypothetical protein VND93_10145 [Myxococcales bacterium]|nr:hypothetical protein [Myxococcales bacterium]
MSPRTLAHTLSLLGALAALAAVRPAAAAPGVGYATSPSYYKKEARPTLYQPLNLLDARELTVWCSRGSDAQDDPIQFGLRGPATIDEIRVYTGNGTDDDTFSEFSRAKKLSLKSPTRGTIFTVADQRGLQAVTLNPPLQGEQFTLEILDAYTADDPESPVCLTDVVFYSDGKPLNGSWMTQKLKYDKSRAQVLGTWYAGYKGAAERYLSFFFDGTYRFLYEPFEKKRGKSERSSGGEYEVRGSTVVLQIPGKGRIAGKLSQTKAGKADEFDDTPASRGITFEGRDVPDDFKQPFRDHN